jgi:hypothetical protein
MFSLWNGGSGSMSARRQASNLSCPLKGLTLSHIDQQRLAAAVGSAYWQKLQSVFLKRVLSTKVWGTA